MIRFYSILSIAAEIQCVLRKSRKHEFRSETTQSFAACSQRLVSVLEHRAARAGASFFRKAMVFKEEVQKILAFPKEERDRDEEGVIRIGHPGT